MPGIFRRVSIFLIIFLLLEPTQRAAEAADLSWSGLYRVEGLKIENAELDGVRRDKAYVLHHLVLQPKVIAADGLTIHGRFDLLNNQTYGTNSQLGQFFGNGPRQGAARTGTKNDRDANSATQLQEDETLAVTQLYAQWVHEFGVLAVGRMPLQFGLGITHNAGLGAFDHWYDSHDIVGYKMIFGNLYVMPMLGKVNEGDISYEDDINDFMVHVQYDNPETDLSLGAFFDWRVGTSAGNDFPSAGVGGTLDAAYKHRLINLFVSEKVSDFKISVEAGLLTGETGVHSAGGKNISLNSYGFAGDIALQKPQSKWDFGMKVGVASGDDAGTPDKYEGFIFDRNYDVAFLLFNHPLGRADFLRTYLNRDPAAQASASVDDEAISNAFYISPRFANKIGDKLSWGGNVTYALLSEEHFAAGMTTGKILGFEVDLNLAYKPYERMTWVTEAGFLFPGDAWKGGTNDFDSKFAFGFTTKAAISF